MYMVYFWIKCDEKSNSVAFQANVIYENYNVWQFQCNNLTHENCNNLPHGGIFTRNTCASKTLAHKAVLIPPIYTTGTHHFLIVSIFQLYLDILAQGEFLKMLKNELLGEVQIWGFLP